MKNLNLIFIAIILSGLISSCKEFIEPSITKRIVTPEAPGNNYKSNQYAVNFWWDEVEDAISYRLQIVTPGFDSLQSLVIDTLVKGSKFTINIDPGNYEWRVRAENGSSQTAYTTPRKFTIIASSLNNQVVTNLSPANNTVTNQNTVAFKWDALFNATKYHLQIDTNNFANESSIISDQSIPGQQFNFKFPKDQQYQWRVRAENETEQSKWSAINFIKYDATPPGITTLIAPLNNAIVSKPVSLQWNTVTGASNYKLYVYKSDSTTLYNNTFPVLLNVSSYNFNIGNSSERIYWKVTALDAVGNEGAADKTRSFVLQ